MYLLIGVWERMWPKSGEEVVDGEVVGVEFPREVFEAVGDSRSCKGRESVFS